MFLGNYLLNQCRRDILNSLIPWPGAFLAVLFFGLHFLGCAAPVPPGSYRVLGETYTPLASADGYSETGTASWYGADFHGKKTANGEIYDMHARTAAHKLLPLGTVVKVTNLESGVSAQARINDRGPFVDGRIIDLSYTLAKDLGITGKGVAKVRVEALAGPGGTPPPTRLSGPFSWQVGAFTVKSNALTLAAKLKAEFGTVSIQKYDRGDALFHRVRVGSYDNVDNAGAILPALLSRGLKPFLVHRD